jgi:predicted PhzF superfamily epimerase YddE/YHI9
MPALIHVDAFTDRPFSGNPAAVCVLDAPADPAWMQSLAAELSLPATAFVWPRDSEFELRWFTSVAELSLCGHGTLATAHVLVERGDAAPETSICFHTPAGTLSARHTGSAIELDFPAEPSTTVEPPPALLRALDQQPANVERNRLDYVVELASEDAVRAFRPDLDALREVETRGLIVTAAASGDGEFVSRFFAPRLGLSEDHVTGSAHCCLGPYWRQRLARDQLIGRQLSPRGGVVRVEVRGERVRLAGQAVTVWRGELSQATLGK